MFDRIVVGVDGSDNSRCAVDVAAHLAELAGAQVIAVHAVGLLEGGGDASQTPADRHAEVRGDLEHVWCGALAHAGIPTAYELRDGNPVVVLLAVARERNADLLVLGTRGLGGFPDQLIGSTSTQVTQQAPCPVVIVPAARAT